MWALLSALRVSRFSWLNRSQCLVFLVLRARLYSLCFLRVILRMELFIHGRWFLLLVVREGIYLSMVSCSFPLKMFQFSFTDLLGCSWMYCSVKLFISRLIDSQSAFEYTYTLCGFFFEYWGLRSISATMISWSDIPGMAGLALRFWIL